MKNNTNKEILETLEENVLETTVVVEQESIKDRIFGWVSRNKGAIIMGAIGIGIGVIGAYASNSSNDDEPSDDEIFAALADGEQPEGIEGEITFYPEAVTKDEV